MPATVSTPTARAALLSINIFPPAKAFVDVIRPLFRKELPPLTLIEMSLSDEKVRPALTVVLALLLVVTLPPTKFSVWETAAPDWSKVSVPAPFGCIEIAPPPVCNMPDTAPAAPFTTRVRFGVAPGDVTEIVPVAEVALRVEVLLRVSVWVVAVRLPFDTVSTTPELTVMPLPAKLTAPRAFGSKVWLPAKVRAPAPPLAETEIVPG